jgi:hypothetical protein
MQLAEKHQEAVAHLLAMTSTATPVVGLHLDDVKWGVSVMTSLIGAVIALYIFERSQVEQARLKHEATMAEERRRQDLLDWEQRLAMREVEMKRRVVVSVPNDLPVT